MPRHRREAPQAILPADEAALVAEALKKGWIDA
jgi:hypothetical protein